MAGLTGKVSEFEVPAEKLVTEMSGVESGFAISAAGRSTRIWVELIRVELKVQLATGHVPDDGVHRTVGAGNVAPPEKLEPFTTKVKP
jgi:hypothetical protein